MSGSTNPVYAPAEHVTDKYLFFYGYELQTPSSRLQNWYPSVFTSPSSASPPLRFPTMEHYIMYRKAVFFGDHDSAAAVLDAATPTEAGALGRKVANFDSKRWKEEVEKVAEEGCWLKFSQVKECREALLGTGERVLVEASPVDRNWGIGFRGDEAEGKESEWGGNLAGKALMKVRDRLRKEGYEREGKM